MSTSLSPAADTAPNLTETVSLVPAEYRHRLIQQLSVAEEKRNQWLNVIAHAPAAQREAIAFLLVNMPDRDLKSLTADFLQNNVALAFEAREKMPWAAAVPMEIFLDAVLPYSNLNERRDEWRTDFARRFAPLVKDCKTAGEAAQLLNCKIFDLLNVHYHATKRPKPDQSPYESTEAHFASCSGLSILLVDACRSVGIPARVAGTPLWADASGNHTWVEVWDGQWRFVGAAEPGPFNKTWFADMAAKADDSKPENRIYAASFRRTKLPFILVWDPNSTDYSSVDVTSYYVRRHTLKITIMPNEKNAPAAPIEIRQDNRLIAQATSSPAEFELPAEADYTVSATFAENKRVEKSVRLKTDQSVELQRPAISGKQ